MKALHMVTFILVAVGGLNWGLIGLGDLIGTELNVVNMILGTWPMLESLVYLIVGLSTLWVLINHPKECRACMSGSM